LTKNLVLYVKALSSIKRDLFDVFRSRVSIWLSLGAMLLIFAAFHAGIERKFDQRISWEAWGRYAYALTVNLTEERYGQSGYAVSDTVWEYVSNYGFTGNPDVAKRLGTSVPENIRDPIVLDGAIAKLWKNLEYFDPIAVFRGVGADDVGLADYTRFAMWTFGHHVRSFYYFYFLVVGVGAMIALFERRRDPVGQTIIIMILAIFYSVIRYSTIFNFEPVGLGTLTNPRFLSSLALLPAAHLLLMLSDKRTAPTAAAIIAAATQAATVFLAIAIRSTATWALAGIAFATLLSAIPFVCVSRKGARFFPGAWLRRGWSGVLTVVVIAGLSQAMSHSMNDVYKSGGYLSGHAFWHSVYYSLMFHPKFVDRFEKAHNNMSGDEMPLAAISNYLDRHPEERTPDILVNRVGPSVTPVAMERFAKKVFIEFALENPRFTIETFLYYKPIYIMDVLLEEMSRQYLGLLQKAENAVYMGFPPQESYPLRDAKAARLVEAVAVLGALLALGMGLARSGEALRRFEVFTLYLTFAVGGAHAIPLITVATINVMSEQYILLQLLIGVWLILFGAVGFRVIDHFGRRNGDSPYEGEASRFVVEALRRIEATNIWRVLRRAREYILGKV